MKAAGHTIEASTDGWFHPLGRVRKRRRPDGTETLTTLLDTTVRATGSRIRTHEVMAGRTAAVDCEHIVRVMAVERTSTERIVFTTQRVPGLPLATMLSDAAMKQEDAAPILLQIAYALSVAHRSLLLHGALCPWSVIVDPAGSRGPVARLSDFGVGWLSWEDHARNPELVPTSPERVLGLGRSPAEDAYLFGCIAYTMLSGHPVFEGGTAEELRRRHAIEDAPPLSRRGSGRAVRYALRRFVMRCLSKEPEDRCKNGDALLVGLLEALADSGITTPYDSIGLLDDALPLPPSGARRPTPIAVPTLIVPDRTPVAAHEDRPPPPTRGMASPPTRRTTPLATPRVGAPAAAGRRATVSALPLTGTGGDVRVPPPPPRRMRWVGAIAVAVTVLAAGAWLSHERFDAVAAPALDAQGDSVAAEPPIAVGSAVPPAIEHALPPAPEPGAGADDIEPIADDSKSDSEGNEEDDAERSPEREIASDKADARLLAGRAREARALGDLAQAERLFERALENRARHVGALTGLAELALDRGDHREAIGYLTRAVKVTPRSSDLRIRLGDAHYKLGELGPARSQYKKAAELGHRSAELRLARVDSAVAESSS